MKIDNPFESGHIKNYILLYVAIVIIMVLFFIATTIFNDNKKIEKKVFEISETKPLIKHKTKDDVNSSRFRLLDKAY